MNRNFEEWGHSLLLQVLDVFRVQRNFLLSSTGYIDPEVPLTGTGPEQARKIREIKEMSQRGKDERLVGLEPGSSAQYIRSEVSYSVEIN